MSFAVERRMREVGGGRLADGSRREKREDDDPPVEEPECGGENGSRCSK